MEDTRVNYIKDQGTWTASTHPADANQPPIVCFNMVPEWKLSWVLLYRENFQEETGYESQLKIVTQMHLGTRNYQSMKM